MFLKDTGSSYEKLSASANIASYTERLLFYNISFKIIWTFFENMIELTQSSCR